MRELLFIVWSAVCGVAALLLLPGTLELLMLSLAALPAVRRMRGLGAAMPWSVAIVVPAHNEEQGIAACVRSLLAARTEEIVADVFVVADNCSDRTAEVARAAGAHVLERVDAVQRGKGYALHFAFTHRDVRAKDAVLVVDADTAVQANFIAAAGGALRDGAEAVQVRYVALNAEESARTRLMALALRAFNVVRPRGRQNLGLSAGILGNGFGLRWETLAAVPYLAASVVEDLEYHLALVRSGRRVVFVDETAVLGEMPVRGKGVETQRSRWEGGRLRMMVQHAPGLFADVLRGRSRSAEPLLDLLLLPLAFHVLLVLVACCSPQVLVRAVGLFGLGTVLVHLAVTVYVGGGGWRDVRTLASAPVYIVWKLLLIPKLFRSARSEQAWVRTARNSETVDGDVVRDGAGSVPPAGEVR